MQTDRYKAESQVKTRLDANEKVLAAYALESPADLLVRRPRAYHLAGTRGAGVPQHGMPVTLVGRLTVYTSSKRDKQLIISNVLDVPGMGGVTLSWISSAKRGKATEIALSSHCPTGTMALVSGKAYYLNDGRLTIRNVEMEPASSAVLAAVQDGLMLPIPIYPLTGRLRQSHVRSAIRNFMREGHGTLKNAMPALLEKQLGLPSLSISLDVVHGIRTVDANQGQLLSANQSKYQRRIDVERLWEVMSRMPQLSKSPSAALALRERCDDVLEGLTYKLTDGQRAALDDVFSDLSKPYVTRRLLQGDVGCGKSIVAILALIAAARSGAPAALLAPTEVLATQLHRAAELLGSQYGIPSHFVSGKLTAAKRRAVETHAQSGQPFIFVGTHALASLPFTRLGVLVIDEEHRFGVELKDRLTAHNPHVITMSATPIPRSLATVMYAGHGVSSIKERPAGRQLVKTKIVEEGGKPKLFGFVRETIAKRQQVFVVCPSIESEEIANVGDAARVLGAEVGSDNVRVLHGEMGSEEIQSTLADFRENKFGVLVATTIIEVGIDVPRATLMIICDPERLGLSQLHQIRGRVGRGRDRGYCALLTKVGGTTRERLEFFANTHDGFALAEKDLQNRGAGDLAGVEQSGFLDVNLLALADEATAVQRFLSNSIAPAAEPESTVDQSEEWLDQVCFEVAI
jgi:ATP-dependent DNA helicase RecG